MKTSILIVGTGNMGSSLTKGLLRSEFAKDISISIFDLHKDKVAALANSFDVNPLQNLSCDRRTEDVIILCIKPQDLAVVSSDLSGKISDQTLIISILAGITTDDVAEQFVFAGPIVRTMPNIAAMVGTAATAMCHNRACQEAHKLLAEKIFSSIGEASWIHESLMDAVTGLSGSGPAYIYMVIEALTDGGVKMGIPRDLSLKLSTQTVLGSALLVKSTNTHPAILRDQVTTPGGTTINAIHELESHGLRAMLISAVATATEKSRELREKRQSQKKS